MRVFLIQNTKKFVVDMIFGDFGDFSCVRANFGAPISIYPARLATNLTAIAGATYLLRAHHIYNLEEHEARMDELEGTLRGHIGLIEEALDRLEGKSTENDRGKKM